MIAHDASRREHWKTMFGPEGASDAILPYAITTIFRRNEELTSLGYKVRNILGNSSNLFDCPVTHIVLKLPVYVR